MTINNKEYKLKKTYRGQMLFEESTGLKIFEFDGSVRHTLILLCCMLSAANPDNGLTLDELLDHIDENDVNVSDLFEEIMGKPNTAANV